MRLLAPVLVFLFAFHSGSAQDQKFHFGLKVLPSMAWIKPDAKEITRDGSRIGFGYGIQTEIRFQENYSFATGLQIQYRGGNLKYTDEVTLPAEVNNEFDIKLQYVEIPLTLKMLTNPFGKIRVYGQFGVSPGYLIRAESSNEIDGDNDFMDYANAFNMNMIIGSGIEYTISGTTVAFVGLEFNNGFLNVFDKKFSEVQPSDAKIKGVSNYLGIHAGVLF
ncbi:MAG: porin family protein [Bacteroidota bacterium]|jgi:hypothetical protein